MLRAINLLGTINASGDFLRTSGIAVSGWAKAYVDTQDHSAASVSGWASSTISGTGTTNAANIASTGATNAAAIVVNTTALNASGDSLLGTINASGDFLRTSGIAVSGWANTLCETSS